MLQPVSRAGEAEEQAPPGPRKYVFAASTGGHLAQLLRFADSLDARPDSMWITFENPQSVSMLQGRRVTFVPYIASRDYRGLLRALRPTREVFQREQFDQVVSTGAGLALAVFPIARLAGIPRTYIESVSRVEGPSLTGRIVAGLHLAALYTQHAGWAGRRWHAHDSVLSLFRSVPNPEPPATDRPLRVLTTLGTIQPFRFDSVIDGLLATGAVGDDSIWQVGATDRTGLPGTTHTQVAGDELLRLAAEADVVVTHAGVGSILALLEAGIHPVVVPRRRSRREHVDDHQLQIARLVDRLGVATVAEATDLTEQHLRQAAALRVVPAT